jgi:tellurite methyltransferase
MINTSNLGKRIAAARKGAGLTQNDLALKVGVTAQAVSKWERGNACPDIAILDEIADALGISLIELLGVDERDRLSTRHSS